MSNFVDLSGWNAVASAIDWESYKHWSKSGDGISRVCFKATEGVGFKDKNFDGYRAAAIEHNIDQIIMYHFARPDLNNPGNEARWFVEVMQHMRPIDILMIDIEQSMPKPDGQWVWQFADTVRALTGRFPIIYASDNYVRTMLQQPVSLTECELILAFWTFNANTRPECPPPWKQYTYLQYTDRAHVPGIPETVDADVYVGGATVQPPPPPPPPTKKPKTFIVTEWPEPGSTLWSIAEIEYSNPLRWTDIYETNKELIGPNPNFIKTGMKLVIP